MPSSSLSPSRRVARPRGRRSPRLLGLGVVACLGFMGVEPEGARATEPSSSPPTQRDQADAATRTLSRGIDGLLDRRFLDDAAISLHVRDLATGETLYERGASRALNPASNIKLVTTAAALSILGPSHRYKTELRAQSAEDGVIEGDLFLVGGGDPSLLTGDLYELASRLRAMGIREIKGGVTVDISLFGTDLLPPGYEQKDEFAAYRAPIGAASVNFNSFEVRVGPGTRNAPARVTVRPPVPSIEIVNEATTRDGTRRRIRIRPLDSSPGDGAPVRLSLKGEVGEDARRGLYRYPVKAPDLYAGEVLALTLRQAGITIGRDAVKIATAPDDADVLATHRSEPLGMVIRAVNKLSSNFMAELVMHGLDPSRPVQPQGGLDRVRDWASAAGLLDGDAWLGNGSGLYDNNRMSAGQLTSLLAQVHQDFRIYGDFLASLAIMGEDGTTRRRLDGTEHAGWVRAKTGTLDGVSALSGYAAVEGRPPVAFSILFNDISVGSTALARRTQDEIVEEIRAWVLHAKTAER